VATNLSDTQWSPSVYFSRTLSDADNLRFGYSHRIDRPSVDQLNPLPWVLGPHDIFIGNPRLRPAQTRSFEAGYDYATKPLSFSGTVYVRSTQDVIAETRTYADAGNTVLISTPVNAGRDVTAGVDMSLDMHPSKAFGLTVSSNIFAVRRTRAPDGVSRALLSHQTKLSVTWAPTAADSLQLQALLNGKSLLADGVQDGVTTVNVTWVRMLTQRLKLVVTGNDVFGGNRVGQHTRTTQFDDDTVVRIPGRIVYVGLKYTFGAVTTSD
jgi:outer membrane receptor protein involved in Fe transport